MLDGYKTKIFSGLLLVSSIIFALGWIDVHTFEVLVGVFGAGAVYGLRKAIK